MSTFLQHTPQWVNSNVIVHIQEPGYDLAPWRARASAGICVDLMVWTISGSPQVIILFVVSIVPTDRWVSARKT